jgi:hypothetical protein
LVIIVAVVVIVIVVFVVVVVVVGANEDKVYFTAGGCCFYIEVDVGEEKAVSAGADGRYLKTSTVPVYVNVIVVDAEVIGAPVDERVGVCEPGFSKKKAVILEGVDQGIEDGRVLLSYKGNVGSMGRKGTRAIWEDDGDGRRRLKRDLMSFYKRRAADVALSTPINEDASGVTIDVADKGKEGCLGLFDSEGRYANVPFLQLMDFALRHGGKNRYGLRHGYNRWSR